MFCDQSMDHVVQNCGEYVHKIAWFILLSATKVTTDIGNTYCYILTIEKKIFIATTYIIMCVYPFNVKWYLPIHCLFFAI